MRIIVLWVMTLYIPLDRYQHFQKNILPTFLG